MSGHDTPRPERTIAADERPSRPDSQAPHAGHETTDVRPGGILALGGALAAVLIGAQVLLLALIHLFSAQAKKEDPAAPPLASQPLAMPGPHLQDAPTADYRRFRLEQEKLLSSYGWTDESHTAARIPVERAMDLVLERGLPTTGGDTRRTGRGDSAREGAQRPPIEPKSGNGPATGVRAGRGREGTAPSASTRTLQLPQNEPQQPAVGD